MAVLLISTFSFAEVGNINIIGGNKSLDQDYAPLDKQKEYGVI